MSSEPPRVTDSPESSRDSVSESYQERLTEVSERSVVSDHGTHPESNGPLPDAVNSVTIKEPR